METKQPVTNTSNDKPIEIYIEGVGRATETGRLNTERLVKRLLKSKYITGEQK